MSCVPQLCHADRARTSTVHAFLGRTVDTVIAAMEANDPQPTTQKSFYVEMSCARDRAELVTDDKGALKEQLEATTGERIAALEAVEPERAKEREAERDTGRDKDRGSDEAGLQGGGPDRKRKGRASRGALIGIWACRAHAGRVTSMTNTSICIRRDSGSRSISKS